MSRRFSFTFFFISLLASTLTINHVSALTGTWSGGTFTQEPDSITPNSGTVKFTLNGNNFFSVGQDYGFGLTDCPSSKDCLVGKTTTNDPNKMVVEWNVVGVRAELGKYHLDVWFGAGTINNTPGRRIFSQDFNVAASAAGNPEISAQQTSYLVGSKVTFNIRNASAGTYTVWWDGDANYSKVIISGGETGLTFTADGRKDPGPTKYCMETGEANPILGTRGLNCRFSTTVNFTVAPPPTTGPSQPVGPGGQLTSSGSGLLFQSNNCSIDIGLSANFLGDVIGDGGKAVGLKLLAQRTATGFLSTIPVVGGIVEGFEKMFDFIFSSWLTAVSWGLFATLLAAITAALTQYALTLNAAIATSNSVVGVGFGIILALVNLGFVAGIVVIALATMLRREEWGVKNLPRFVVAALLINFSLFFAGAILNASSAVINAFLKSGACTGNFFTQFNILTINQTLENVANASGGVEGMVLSVTSLYIAALLTFIGALSFAAIFLFLIARYVAVTILLIFMPIAWLGLAFPKLNFPLFGSAWSGWWNEFIKWVITGPIIAFFIYLSTYLVSNLGSISITGGGPIVVIGQMIAVVAISLGGLYTASKMGGVGSAFITGAMGLGLGATAGGWTKFMQRQQLAAETRSKIHPTGVRGFLEKGLAKSFKATAGAPGLIFAKPLAQAGIKLPEGKKLTDREKRVERANSILGRVNTARPETLRNVLQLTPGDITGYSSDGTPDDRKKIRDTVIALSTATPVPPLSTQESSRRTAMEAQISRLILEGRWDT